MFLTWLRSSFLSRRHKFYCAWIECSDAKCVPYSYACDRVHCSCFQKRGLCKLSFIYLRPNAKRGGLKVQEIDTCETRVLRYNTVYY